MSEAWQRSREGVPRTDPVPRDVGEALAALSENQLLRLRALAQLRARGLPGGVSWSDLLHEAVVRALAGTRPWPPGVPLVAFLAGVMRSLCDEHWRRHRRWNASPAADGAGSGDGGAGHATDPERACAATEALAAIHRLFASDPLARTVIAGLTEGLTPEEIRCRTGLGAVEYDTVRRRMRRALLRHGLAWTWP